MYSIHMSAMKWLFILGLCATARFEKGSGVPWVVLPVAGRQRRSCPCIPGWWARAPAPVFSVAEAPSNPPPPRGGGRCGAAPSEGLAPSVAAGRVATSPSRGEEHLGSFLFDEGSQLGREAARLSSFRDENPHPVRSSPTSPCKQGEVGSDLRLSGVACVSGGAR